MLSNRTIERSVYLTSEGCLGFDEPVPDLGRKPETEQERNG